MNKLLISTVCWLMLAVAVWADPQSGADVSPTPSDDAQSSAVLTPSTGGLSSQDQTHQAFVLSQINTPVPSPAITETQVFWSCLALLPLLIFIAIQVLSKRENRLIFNAFFLFVMTLSLLVRIAFPLGLTSPPATPSQYAISYYCNLDAEKVLPCLNRALDESGFHIAKSDSHLVWGVKTLYASPENRIAIFVDSIRTGCQFTIDDANIYVDPFNNPKQVASKFYLFLQEALRETAGSMGDGPSAFAAYEFYNSQEKTYANQINAEFWLEQASQLGYPVDDNVLSSLQSNVWWLFIGGTIEYCIFAIVVAVGVYLLGVWALILFALLLHAWHYWRVASIGKDAYEGKWERINPVRIATTALPFARRWLTK